MVNKSNATKEETDYFFNEGRLNCYKKWQEAIKDRIEELEKSVGIPELRKLLKDYRYTWKNDSPKETKTQ